MDLPKSLSIFIFFLSSLHHLLYHSHAQQPNTTGYTCNTNQTTYPCQTFAYYRANSPYYLSLADIGDLFSASRRMIANPSNISDPSAPLVPEQPVFVPLSCSCNRVNSSTVISYASLNYTIQAGDTFYLVSTFRFQNLTTFQSVIVVNPDLVPTELEPGDNVVFPIFCKCPNQTQLGNGVNYLVSYVLQPSDNLSAVASMFGVETQAVIDVNGNDVQPFETVFVPVTNLPVLTQPAVSPSPAPSSPGSVKIERKGVITGLAVGLGITGILLILVSGLLVYWGLLKKKTSEGDEKKENTYGGGRNGMKEMEVHLMADVSDCLDKYRVFGIDQLREATDGFKEDCLIHGSVYKGSIDGEVYAIKKMNWNAREELKILQKVNHGNLVKLEGFCIDPEDASCYLIYEYVENGSLHSWLHGNKNRKPDWKTRLRIAVDVANGLQYIHEHTRPRVVHKDIKSSNILLDRNMRAKIANFGLAKSGCNAITMHIVGTQGYISPEYLTDGVVSTKMDVFSFGVVLLELVSGKEAIDAEGNVLWAKAKGVAEGTEETKAERVKEWMDDDLFKYTISMENVMNVMNVAIACIHKDPAKRPSMVDIVYALCKSNDIFFDISEDGFSTDPILAR